LEKYSAEVIDVSEDVITSVIVEKLKEKDVNVKRTKSPDFIIETSSSSCRVEVEEDVFHYKHSPNYCDLILVVNDFGIKTCQDIRVKQIPKNILNLAINKMKEHQKNQKSLFDNDDGFISRISDELSIEKFPVHWSEIEKKKWFIRRYIELTNEIEKLKRRLQFVIEQLKKLGLWEDKGKIICQEADH
jgi:hypothetical protein